MRTGDELGLVHAAAEIQINYKFIGPTNCINSLSNKIRVAVRDKVGAG